MLKPLKQKFPLYKIGHYIIMTVLAGIIGGAVLFTALLANNIYDFNTGQARPITIEDPITEDEFNKSLEYLEEKDDAKM